jgi:hypothetical protein
MWGGREIAPASCDAQVAGVSAHPPRVLYHCKPTHGTRAQVIMAGLERTLPMRAESVRDEEWRGWIPRFTESFACRDDYCVDLGTGEAYLDPFVTEANLIVRRGRRCLFEGTPRVIADMVDGSRLTLDAGGGSLRAAAGSIVVVGREVIDLDARKSLGFVSGKAFAVDRSGRVLTNGGADGPHIPIGPLRWRSPVR